jgi:hypothetical protein
MKPNAAMADKLIAVDGTKDGVIELTKAMGTRSLGSFYGLLGPEEIKDIVEFASANIDVTAGLRPILTENLDAEDVLEAIAFHQSPCGEKMTKIKVSILFEIVQVISQMGKEISERCVQEAIRRIMIQNLTVGVQED